jgi:SHS2 domain-containing protein
MYELIDHTADLGLRIVADDLDTLFREAAEGLFSIIVEEIPPNPSSRRRGFSIPGDRLDHLILDWLTELLYVFETEGLLFRDFDVRVSRAGLEATGLAQPVDPTRHRMLREVKAITYHRLQVKKTEHGWIAELVVDI